MLKVWGVLVLVFALWTGCSDDEGTKTKTKTKTKEEKEKEIKESALYKKLDSDLKKKDSELKEAKKKLDTWREPSKIYVWTLSTAAEDGDWAGGADRMENVDAKCTSADKTAGKPDVVKHSGTDATHVTRTLALTSPTLSFVDLGLSILLTRGDKASVNALGDEVWGISADGKKSKKLSDNYFKFFLDEWENSLQDAGVAPTADTQFWIGAHAAGGGGAGANDDINHNCQDFNSNTGGGRDPDTGTTIVGSAKSTDHDNNVGNADVSPLRLRIATDESAEINCDATAKILCISFPKK